MNALTIEQAIQALILLISNAMDLASKIQSAHTSGAAGLSDADVDDFRAKDQDAKKQLDVWIAEK